MLLKHEEHPEARFSCEDCDLSFTFQRNLTVHRRYFYVKFQVNLPNVTSCNFKKEVYGVTTNLSSMKLGLKKLNIKLTRNYQNLN